MPYAPSWLRGFAQSFTPCRLNRQPWTGQALEALPPKTLGSPMQRRPGGAGGSGSGSGAAPPCHFYLRGYCRFGAACRFSHEPAAGAGAGALPFHHRQLVQSQVAASLAEAASASRLRVMSYNCLADCLAYEHAAELYSSAPRFALEWGRRSSLIVREILHHRPDVVCLQEVDHFRQYEEALQPHGYQGVYTKRTGDRRDGLAMFWQTESVRPVKQRFLQFSQYGMKDNVAQLLVFQPCSSSSGGDCSSSETSSEGSTGSLSGQKRRQAEQTAGSSRHVRFNSSSDDEGGCSNQPPNSAKRRGSMPSAAAAAAMGAISIEDAAEAAEGLTGCPRSAAMAATSEQVEPATELADIPPAAAAAEASQRRQQQPGIVCANIHVLFNPKRGDIKMGQVRTLLETVNSVCLQQQKRSGQRAAAIICGDFNSAAGSSIYEFVRAGELDLSQHDRRRMSGQVESPGRSWRALQQSFLARQQQLLPSKGSSRQALPSAAWSVQPSPLLDRMAAAAVAGFQQPPPPYAPLTAFYNDGGIASSGSSSSQGSTRTWRPEDTRMAAGSSCSGGVPVARHPLRLESAYRAVTGAEAPYTTCHDKFIGCVDYVWFTPSTAGGWQLVPLAVLQPPPLQTLDCAQPSSAWPSDHISLVCDFALVPSSQ